MQMVTFFSLSYTINDCNDQISLHFKPNFRLFSVSTVSILSLLLFVLVLFNLYTSKYDIYNAKYFVNIGNYFRLYCKD